VNNLVNELYSRYLALDEDAQGSVLSRLFARMRYLREHGTEDDKKVAERFYMEMEHCIGQQEIFFRKGAIV